jgi:sugar O-acyltransferase (sialic acid O-acetyltransferase NeuD family)
VHVTAPLFIVGAGGFGREVFSIIEALRSTNSMPQIAGFIDDHPSAADLKNLASLGSRRVGSIDDLVRRAEPFSAVVAVSSAVDRETIADLLAPSPVTFPVLVHPDATIGCDVYLAEGVVVAAGSRLSTNIHVGRHVQIDQNAAIGHDCSLGEFARLNPQACVSGSVTIGRRAMIGANAIVLQGLSVGDDAKVGAGAVVTHSVEAATTVMGVPAR